MGRRVLEIPAQVLGTGDRLVLAGYLHMCNSNATIADRDLLEQMNG